MKRAFGMSKCLAQRGHQPSILLEDHPANRACAKDYPDVELIYFPPVRPRAESRLKQQMLGQRDDEVVVVCSLSVRNMVKVRRKNAPVQVLDHPEITSAFEDWGYARRSFEYAADWWSLFAYDGHLAVSRYLEKRLRSRLQRIGRPPRVLYSPFAAEDELRREAPTEGVKALYGGRKIVLYLGSFISAYGFQDMLAAAAELSKQRDDFVLVMAGAGGELEAGRQYISEHGLQNVVAFPGFLSGDSLLQYIHAAHAFICPLNDTIRDWARSPGKIYMYAATGRPIVTCRIGEAIDTLGDAGFYYDPGSADSMAAQIDVALDFGGGPVPGYSREALFWDYRTDRFLEWLAAEFSLPRAG